MLELLLNGLRTFLSRMARRDAAPDPLASFTARDWADLPVHHPERDA